MLVDLTPSGARALKRLDKQIDAAQQTLLEPLSAAERRQLERLLGRLVEHHSPGQAG
jgi:DNA-binding MarR family transcriptional regulator